METLKEQMVSDIGFLEPPVGITVQPTGSFEMFTTLLSSMSESKEQMNLLGFIFVFVFLILVYRHLHAVSPIIPIILIVGWNAVAMYILGIDYSPLTATLGSMTIGVAAEYTILVMERYAEEEERLHDPDRRHPGERAEDRYRYHGLGPCHVLRVLGALPCNLPDHQQLRCHHPDCGGILPAGRDLHHAGSAVGHGAGHRMV